MQVGRDHAPSHGGPHLARDAGRQGEVLALAFAGRDRVGLAGSDHVGPCAARAPVRPCTLPLNHRVGRARGLDGGRLALAPAPAGALAPVLPNPDRLAVPLGLAEPFALGHPFGLALAPVLPFGVGLAHPFAAADPRAARDAAGMSHPGGVADSVAGGVSFGLGCSLGVRAPLRLAARLGPRLAGRFTVPQPPRPAKDVAGEERCRQPKADVAGSALQ